MKKILLLLMTLVVAALQSMAAQLPPGENEVTWEKDGYTVKFDKNAGPEGFELKVSGPGALAAFFADADNAANITAIGNINSTKLKIMPLPQEGAAHPQPGVEPVCELNADDFSALNSTTHSELAHFTTVNLKNVTVTGGISALSDMNLTGMQYLRLPNGLTSADDVTAMASMRTQSENTSLKVVGSSDQGVTEMALYSFESNNVPAFSDALFGGYNAIGSGQAPEKTMVRMGGLYGDRDLYDGHTNFGKVLSFDFTGATFDEYIIPSLTTDGSYSDPTHPYARGLMSADGSGYTSEPNDPFALPGQAYEAPMVLDGYKTNALYFLNKYEFFTSVILPTGNTDIPPQTFKDRVNLTSITIPDNYITIGHEAFMHTGITDVTIGKNVKTIEAGAFVNNGSLEDVKFQPGLDDQIYGPYVFYNCQNIKHVVLPEGIKTLGAYMFKSSKNIESVRLPETLENIGTGCFWDAEGLASITLPSNLKKIGMKAFMLTSITDVYLTTTDPAKLPLIYTMGNNFEQADQNSSFAQNMMNNIATNGKETQNNGASLSEMTWEEACFDYFFTNGVAVLHFPKTLADKVHADISKRYAWPTKDNVEGDEYAKMPDRNEWINGVNRGYNDFDIRCRVEDKVNVGTSGQGIWTTDGWAQFLLMKAYEPNEESIVYTKEFDDTWYTICFPFEMTDEQLAVAFNEGFNICDFNAVEIKTNAETQKKSLVLHFNSISKAVYKDLDGTVYTRQMENGVAKKDDKGFNIYDGPDGVYKHYEIEKAPGAKTFVREGTTTPVVYIEGYLAEGGRPYMIHPNLGVSLGQPKVACRMSGITWIGTDDFDNDDTREKLYEAKKRTIDLGVERTLGEEEKTVVAFSGYEGRNGEQYTFKGNYRDLKASAPESIKNAKEPVVTDYTQWYPDGPPQTMSAPENTPEAQVGPRMTEADKPEEKTDPQTDEAYPEVFQTFYNTVFQFNGQDRTAGEEILNWQFSSLVNPTIQDWGVQVYQFTCNMEGLQVALKTYFGDTYDNKSAITASLFSETALNTLKGKCQAFHDALEEYSDYPATLAAYEANVTAWAAYDAAVAAAASYSYETEKSNYDTAITNWEDAVQDWKDARAQYQVLIPYRAYFLGRAKVNGVVQYPKWYREISNDQERTSGFWTQYAAIVEPNSQALAGIETELNTKTSNAKDFTMVFDEDFYVINDIINQGITTQVEKVIEEKPATNVEYMDVVISVDGKVISRDKTSIEGLPKGVYIINGKKYFVK